MLLTPISTTRLLTMVAVSKLATFENVRESVAVGWIST
jgi:hypothetical protein